MSDRLVGVDGRRGRASSAVLGALVLGSPPIVLATAAIAGIGLARDASGSVALSCGLCLTLLPILGLSSLSGRRPIALVLCCWIWSLMLLTALPLYFPGERSQATSAGLRLLARPAGPGAAAALGEVGARLVAVLGSERKPLVRPIPAPEMKAEGPADEFRLLPASPGPGRSGPAEANQETRENVILLPYAGSERSLRVSVEVDGPWVGEQFDMIFDTGATYTTLSHRALEMLEIEVPADAPQVTLRTANGEIRAPLVLIDAIWLGDAVVEWVTVSACDSCATPPSAGLLGLNVSRQFRVSINHDRKRIELRPRRYRMNRQLDISQWLEIRSSATRFWDGAVEVELTGSNRSQREIERAVVELGCGEEAFAVQLDHIPPKGEASTTVSLPRGTNCERQSIRLSRALWLLDRF